MKIFFDYSHVKDFMKMKICVSKNFNLSCFYDINLYFKTKSNTSKKDIEDQISII